MSVGLPPLRVCRYLVTFSLISSRSQLKILRVYFYQGVGFKYNLVCSYGRSTQIYIV